jgi:short-subunit dehydrogenase
MKGGAYMSVALITGASSGIGMEFARQLAQSKEVDEFWLVARRKERMESLAEELSVPCRIIVADLAGEEGIDTLKSALETEKPSVKWLICAAGFGLFGDYSQVPEKQVVGMIDVNVKALVRVTYMTIPYMPAGGHILEMGSGSCFTPLPNFNVYASSKAFVLHFGKALRYEVKKQKLSVTRKSTSS